MRWHPMDMNNEWKVDMNRKPIRMEMNGTEPMVRQPMLNEWVMSWNPDDDLFYIETPAGIVRKKFKHWRNAVAWARDHAVE